MIYNIASNTQEPNIQHEQNTSNNYGIFSVAENFPVVVGINIKTRQDCVIYKLIYPRKQPANN